MDAITSAIPDWLNTLHDLETSLKVRAAAPPANHNLPAPAPTPEASPFSPSLQPLPAAPTGTTTVEPPAKIAGYTIHHKIGTGSFGVLYSATEHKTGKAVAFKFESSGCESPQLRDEYRAYKLLAGCNGICTAYALGDQFLHHYLILDQLGPSLEMLFSKCKRKFSMKTVCMLGIQMIDRLHSIHSRNLVYRDIKPQNFLLGLPGTPTANQVFLVDLGMVKEFIDPITKKHITQSGNRALSGTVQFLSNNAVRAFAQSRRDDLESLLLVLIYFLNDGLPWATAGSTEAIARIKQETTPEALCARLPPQFLTYLLYIRNVPFADAPDYSYLQSLLTDVLTSLNTTNDLSFDWGRVPTVSSLHPILYSLPHQTTLYTLHKSLAATRYRLMRATRPTRPAPRLSSTLALMSSTGNPLAPRPRQTPPPLADEQLSKAQKTLVSLADKILRDTTWPDDLAIIRAALQHANFLATASRAAEHAHQEAAAAAKAEAETEAAEAAHLAAAEKQAIAEAAAASPSPTTRVYRRPLMTTRPNSKDGSKCPTSTSPRVSNLAPPPPPPPDAPIGKGAAPPEPTASALLPKMEDYAMEAAPLEVDDGGDDGEEGEEEEEAFVVPEYHNGKKKRGAVSLR